MSRLFILLLLSFLNLNAQQSISNELSSIENGLLPNILIKGDSLKTFSLSDRMKHYKVPGVSIAIVQNGEIKWARAYGTANTNNGTKVNTETLFQAGSISKPLAAIAALKLVEEGKIDLDENVNSYLKTWKLPENQFTNKEKVTLRRLLTHTGGLTVSGFPGYKQSDVFPTDIEVLNGEGNTPRVFVDTIPGSIWRYSGGGYTVMERMVEDVSELPFEDIMEEILNNIGMKNSTFNQPLDDKNHSNVSAAYDNEGEIIEGLWHNYPEQAAAGLWTTPSDLAKYCMEIQEILAGKENGVLSGNTVDMMLTKHKNDWGLGPALMWEKDSLIFRHGGKNAGFTNNLVSFANRRDAVIIMTNADKGGMLMQEILHSVSNYYNWGVSEPKEVETIELPFTDLQKFTGKYKLDFQVPEIGDYIIEIKIKDRNLFVEDPHDKDNSLIPTSKFKFIDPESGSEIIFEEGLEGFSLNGRFQFNKLK